MNADFFRKWGAFGVLFGLLNTYAHAQGVVLFANQPLGTTRRVFMPDGTTLISGTNFKAQLMYRDNTGTWVAHPNTAPFFASSLTTFRGYWNGSNRTLTNAGGTNAANGGSFPVVMAVRVWDGGSGATPLTFEQARAQGMLSGESPVFCYIEEFDSPAGTDDKQMKNFPRWSWLPSAPPTPQFTSVSRDGDQLRFYVRDAYWFTSTKVVLETKTDLSNSEPWIPVHTNLVPFWFTNSAPSADRQRFYRAVFPASPGPCPP